jgi:hypothetical protein
MSRRYFRIKRIALGLAFAAVAVPTAQAKPAPWTPAPRQPVASEISVQSPGSQLGATTIKLSGAALVNAPAPASVQSPAYSSAYQAKVEALRYQAMARAYLNNPGTISASGAVNSRHTALSSLSVPVSQTTSSDGFKWSDAGIGAAVAFGAALMLLMAVVLGRRFRSRPTGLAST